MSLKLKGALAEKKQKKLELKTDGKRLVKSARDILEDVFEKPFEKIDLAGAVSLLNQALEKQEKLGRVLAEIEEIEEELG